jgi:hypothetical protein
MTEDEIIVLTYGKQAGGPSYREAKGGDVSFWEYSNRANVQPSQRDHRRRA